MSLALSIPATCGLWLLSEPITQVIFQYGHFTPESTRMTALALDCFVVGLFAYAAVKVTVPVFYALDETRFPVVGSFIAVAVNLAVVLLTIKPLAHRAMALGISLGMVGNFLFLFVAVYRRLGGFSLKHLAGGIWRIILAAALMGGLVRGGLAVISVAGVNRLAELVILLATICLAALLYGLVLHLLGLKEFTTVVERVRARLAPSKG